MVLRKRILLPVLVVFFSVRVVTGFGNLQQQTWVVVVKTIRFHIRDTLCGSFFKPTTDLYFLDPCYLLEYRPWKARPGVVGVVVDEGWMEGWEGWDGCGMGGWRKGKETSYGMVCAKTNFRDI